MHVSAIVDIHVLPGYRGTYIWGVCAFGALGPTANFCKKNEGVLIFGGVLIYRQVNDQDSWLEAWTIYMAATLSAAPERALELVGYQAIILDAMRRFPGRRSNSLRCGVSPTRRTRCDNAVGPTGPGALRGPADRGYPAAMNGQSPSALSSAPAHHYRRNEDLP